MIPGRGCPLSYRYGAEALRRPPAIEADSLWVAGGLYGNRFALERLVELYEAEQGSRALVFNGDFHWFDVDPAEFAAVDDGVHRYRVTRGNVDEDMYGNHPRFAAADVSLQSAEAYYAFAPEQAAHRISPRPLLIVHGALNELHPIDEARSLYARAREPKELIELPAAHHLDWIQPGDPQYIATLPRLLAWFQRHLPPGGDS